MGNIWKIMSYLMYTKDKNLEESDITGAMDKILSGLKNIGIQLRG